MRTGISDIGKRRSKVRFAQKLRNQQTSAEVKLWGRLRRKQLGMKFRRQAIIGTRIVDFLCLQKRLVIEIDGGIHLTRKDVDEYRDQLLVEQNYTVIRFTNEQVDRDLEYVVERIKRELSVSPQPPTS